MINIQLVNYLRTERRQTGLTQEEFAELLGVKDGSQIAHYERNAHVPILEHLISYEIIFGLGHSLARMYPGIAKQVAAKLRERACRLRKRLLVAKNRNAQTERKMETLHSLCDEPFEPHSYYSPHYFDPDCHTNQISVQFAKAGPPVWAGERRFLAIDPTSRGFGYAILEINPTRLLDWSVANCRDYLRLDCLERLEDLIRYFKPTAILVEDSCPIPSSRCHKLRPFIRKVRNLLKAQRIPLQVVSSARVRTVFAAEGARNQEERAKVVARHYPEISYRLPPHRTTWMTEDYWMSVFDALALIYAYLKVEGNKKYIYAQNNSQSS